MRASLTRSSAGDRPPAAAREDDRVTELGRVPRLSDIEMINAVTLVTADMATSCAFYETLGFERVVGGPHAPFTTYRVGPGFLNVQLDPAHAPVPAIWGRVIFWVADVDAMYERALGCGCEPEMAPSDAPWGERYFHLRDPDGHELSFARLISGPGQ
jgi:catechol 2,3-dioxygenase-like lactoylglutathione lyase family enzyme